MTYNLSEGEAAIIDRMRMAPADAMDALVKVEAGVVPHVSRMKALARAVASQKIEHYLAAQVLAAQILSEPTDSELQKIDELETKLAIYAEELLASNEELKSVNALLQAVNEELRESNREKSMEVKMLEARTN